MSSKAEILANFDDVWGSIDDLIGSMSEEDWTVQSLCPDWTAFGVIAHLAGVEHALAGWRPTAAEDPLPFGAIADYLQGAAGWSGAQLAEDYQRLLRVRREELESMSEEAMAQPAPTPVGPATYGRFMDIRVFDFWVHERDIRIPLDRPAASESGPAAERSVDEVAMSIGYIAGKKIGLGAGQSLAFRLTGGVPREINVAEVDGRARAVESVDDPTTVVTADSTSFVMLACGRVDPQGEIDAGRISWEGDADLGDRAARSLRFTM